jgi:hypothetical protein
MKAELTAIKVRCDASMVGQDIIIPATETAMETMKSLPYAEKMTCNFRYRTFHNIERHDLFWACFELVRENLGVKTFELEEKVKLDCRFVKGYIPYNDKNGKERIHVILKSLKFSALTIEDAKTFYSVAFDKLAEYIGVTTEELVNEAKLRMKGKHYCLLCGNQATTKHHKFSQTKWAIEKYGKKLIDDEKNIEWICLDCHGSHAKIPPELIWSEKKFRAVMGLDKVDENYNYSKEAVKEIFEGTEVTNENKRNAS